MNQKMKKTIASFCVSTMVLTATPAVVLANPAVIQENGSQVTMIAPRMQYIDAIYCYLSIDGTTASVECSVEGDYYDATKAKVIAELQVKSGSDWIPVKIWTETVNGSEAYVDETHPIVDGHTYRVKATATVWEGSLSETQVVFSDELP